MTNLKTYQAESMSDALAEVKRDLGRDAVILHTRSIRKSRFLGLLRRKSMWEITAAPNVNVIPRSPGRPRDVVDEGRYLPTEPPHDGRDLLLDNSDSGAFPAEDVAGPATVDRPIASDAPRDTRQPMGGQITQIHDMLQTLLDSGLNDIHGKLPAPLQEFHDDLCCREVDERIATDLITRLRMELTGQQLSDRQAMRQRLVDLIAARIPCAPEPQDQPQQNMRSRTIALIGPTGVGKTTTIAKLAANMKLKEKKRVGLITIDTYRIAAVDQLKTYAEIIEVPLRTAATAQEMHQAIYAMRGLDTILIDTVGRSQNDQLRLNQLRSFLAVAEPDEVHLVLAATANRRCAANVVARFRPLGVNRLIVTKLDEAEACGMVLNIASDGKAPLSYVSSGQEVPDDIAPADAGDLARRVMGGFDHDA